MKKFLFIAFVLMIGTSVFMNAHNQQTNTLILDKTVEANRTSDFKTLNTLYTWAHNSDYITFLGNPEEGPQVILFESSVLEFDNNSVTGHVPTITFIIRNLDGIPLTAPAGTTNQASIALELAGASEDFRVDFVRTDSELSGVGPNYVDLERDRNFITMVRSFGFMHFSVRTYDITNDGEFNIINGLRLYDALGNERLAENFTYDITDSLFFDIIDDLNVRMEESDASHSEILNQWRNDHSDLFGDEGTFIFGARATIGFSEWMRILLEVGMYVLLFGVLGFFLFRRKRDPRAELAATNHSKK